jgi:predicted TIM-barrel fold metal-dependent hydrolase
MFEFGVVDAHFHLIDPVTNPYPWLEPHADRPDLFAGRDEQLRHIFVEEHYKRLAEPVGITKAVHLQANWDPADPIGETAWLHENIERTGFPDAVVAFANLSLPDVEETLAAHASYPRTRGIRHILNWHAEPRMRQTDREDYLWSADWRRGFALLEKYGLSFDLQVYPHQLPAALELATEFPETTIILNHAGMPFWRAGRDIREWRDWMAELATAPNVAVKISGLGIGDPDWTLDSMRPIVLGSIEAFGPERSMFASNFPVDALFSDFHTLWEAFDTLTAEFSADERRAMFKTNAERYYRISSDSSRMRPC